MGIYTVLANPIYMVYIWQFWLGNHQVYGHIQVYIRFWPTLYIWCIYGNFGRETTKYMVIYGYIYSPGQRYSCNLAHKQSFYAQVYSHIRVYIQFWPTLLFQSCTQAVFLCRCSNQLQAPGASLELHACMCVYVCTCMCGLRALSCITQDLWEV